MFRTEEQLSLTLDTRNLLRKILNENEEIGKILLGAASEQQLLRKFKELALSILNENPPALKYFQRSLKGPEVYQQLRWKDFAAIRILDYIDHTGEGYQDSNMRGQLIINNPLRTLWIATRNGSGPGTIEFYMDMLHLFRQLSGQTTRLKPNHPKLEEWMIRFESGLDPEIIQMRIRNRERILKKIILKIERGEVTTEKFRFPEGISQEKKIKMAHGWWKDKDFHLKMAIRSTDELNDYLDYTLDRETLSTIRKAEDKGIPIFVNPYYLSLLNIEDIRSGHDSDKTLRDYIFPSRDLLHEFGHIHAWEKEDEVKPNKPNAAGWLLPEGYDLHRRYPEVAIFIPRSTGRSCGGLCVSCQRMYDFQSGHFNFDLEKLKPRANWTVLLKGKMEYFRNDSQLRDILITGGDALMSSDRTLRIILDHVYDMARQKIEDNESRPEGKKYAEMVRIRLGTRLPVYLPHRITHDLVHILKEFREKAVKIGIQQFVVQTHFVSALEITPEAREAVKRLLSSGWMVTNQEVFTTAASRRGHSAKLRKVLNDIGILTYYTFQVKGHSENKHNFAPIARSVQEQHEEKSLGKVPGALLPEIKKLTSHPDYMVEQINHLRHRHGLPFLATDRNVMNIPGVGKSLTFRVVGLTNDGRRILEFEHDHTRNHSPIIENMEKVTIIESKSIARYLKQLEKLGENPAEYHAIYGYTIGETEGRMPIYEYPEYTYRVTDELTNLQL